MTKPTSTRLRELLVYDPSTGVFQWKIDVGRWGRIKAGSIATVVQGPYLKIRFGDKYEFAHRVVWCYMTGEWPVGEIDHKDRYTMNNRFSNLRDVSRGVNAQNRAVRQKNNQGGLLGVSWHKKDQKWRARIQTDRKSVYLGEFQTRDAAFEAYLQAKRKHHVGCTI